MASLDTEEVDPDLLERRYEGEYQEELAEYGLVRLGDIVFYTQEELKNRGISFPALQSVQLTIREMGLHLGMKPKVEQEPTRSKVRTPSRISRRSSTHK